MPLSRTSQTCPHCGQPVTQPMPMQYRQAHPGITELSLVKRMFRVIDGVNTFVAFVCPHCHFEEKV